MMTRAQVREALRAGRVEAKRKAREADRDVGFLDSLAWLEPQEVKALQGIRKPRKAPWRPGCWCWRCRRPLVRCVCPVEDMEGWYA